MCSSDLPGLIAIEEIPQPNTPLSQTHFGGVLYLYQSFPQSFPSAFVDPIAIQSPVDFGEYTFGHTTMSKPTSLVGSAVPITSAPTLATLSMFTTSPESYFHGHSSVPIGYKSLSGTFSGAPSHSWSLPMSSSGVLIGIPIVSTERLDSLNPSLGQYQADNYGSNPLSFGLLAFGEKYFPSYYPPYAGGQPSVT